MPACKVLKMLTRAPHLLHYARTILEPTLFSGTTAGLPFFLKVGIPKKMWRPKPERPLLPIFSWDKRPFIVRQGKQSIQRLIMGEPQP
jgi:hypothetical protein